MQSLSKNWGATNAPRSLADKNKTECQYSLAVQGLQALRDIAWKHAIKYRWDPVLSQTHEEYLTLLNGLLMECGP